MFNIFIEHDLHQTKRKQLPKPFKQTYSHINLLKQFSTFHFQFSIPQTLLRATFIHRAQKPFRTINTFLLKIPNKYFLQIQRN